MAFATLSPAGLSQVAGETGDRIAADHLQRHDPVPGRNDRSVHRRPRRRRGAGGNAHRLRRRATLGLCAAKRNPNDALAAIYTKAPPVGAVRASAGAYGQPASAARRPPTAMPHSAPIPRPSRIYGTAVGADYRFSPNTMAGFALAGGGTNFSVAMAGTGRSDLFQAGAFIRHNIGPAYVTAALAYGWQDVTTDRTVTIAGIDQLRARFNANAWSGRVEGGYRFVHAVIGGFGLTPYAAGQFTTFDLPAYAEAARRRARTPSRWPTARRDVTDSRSELGFRTDKSFAMPRRAS